MRLGKFLAAKSRLCQLLTRPRSWRPIAGTSFNQRLSFAPWHLILAELFTVIHSYLGPNFAMLDALQPADLASRGDPEFVQVVV
jgi:hypothetical protein